MKDEPKSVGILTETTGLYDLTAERAASQVERYLHLLDLWERRDDKVGGFSKGMRQKLAIARSLLHEPKIIFLDEPTSGPDPEAARVVRDFIKQLRTEGQTLFLTTHNLPKEGEPPFFLIDALSKNRLQ